MKKDNDVVNVLVAVGRALLAAAEEIGGTVKGEPAPVAAEEPEAEPAGEDEPESAEPEKVVIPADVGEMKKADVVALFKSAGLKNASKEVLQVIAAILSGSRTVAADYNRAALFATADVVGAEHRKTSVDTVKGIRAALKKLPFELADAEPEEPEAADDEPAAPAKGKVTKPANDEPEPEEEPEAEPEAPSSEAEFDKLARKLVGSEEDLEDPDAVKQAIQDWLDKGTPEDHARYDKIAALMKKGKWYEAAILYYSAYLGASDGTYDISEDDTPYVRGEEVWCNGAPLNNTSDESIGRDWVTGKCWTVNEENEIVAADDPDKKKAKVKIGKK